MLEESGRGLEERGLAGGWVGPGEWAWPGGGAWLERGRGLEEWDGAGG